MTSSENVSSHKRLLMMLSVAVFVFTLGTSSPSLGMEVNASSKRIQLDRVVILVDGKEPPYVRYATNDLATYLRELATQVTIGTSPALSKGAKTIIAIGEQMSHEMGAELPSSAEGFLIRS